MKVLNNMCGKKKFARIGNTNWAKKMDFWITKSTESRWAFIPKEGIPGTFSQNFEKQSTTLEKYPDYGTCSALELSIGAVLNFLKNTDKILENSLLRCSDHIGMGSSGVVSGGLFDFSGFRIGFPSVKLTEFGF